MDYETHPVFSSGRFIIPTASINEFINVVKHWANASITGGIICGDTRAGKSFALRYLMNNVIKVFGKQVPILHVDWSTLITKKRESGIYVKLLDACDHDLSTDGVKPDVLEVRLINYLRGEVDRLSDSRVILFIDEAHKISTNDYDVLSIIFNLLQDHDIQLHTYLIGEERLAATRENYIKTGDGQYVGRFMWSSYQFKGIRSTKELRQVMTAYDSKLHYPVGSNTSFTQSIAPKAFAGGWRLAKESKRIWEYYMQIVPSDTEGEMVMQLCVILLNRILNEARKHDDRQFKIRDDRIHELIDTYYTVHSIH